MGLGGRGDSLLMLWPSTRHIPSGVATADVRHAMSMGKAARRPASQPAAEFA